MTEAHGNARRRGTAVVEMAILLPAYALVVLASLYFGYGMLVRQEGAESDLWAAHTPGSQAGELLEHYYLAYEGSPRLEEEGWQGDIFWAENPAGGNDPFDFHDILQELSYTFWGGFQMIGGNLEWVNQGGLNSTGQYIKDHHIMGEEELSAMAWTMNGWVTRNIAKTTYDYAPTILGGMNAEAGPAAPKANGDRFEALAIETLVDAMVRGERARPLASSSLGVSSNVYELINRFADAEQMPGLPDFEGSKDFWDQNSRP
jgi:hypothetical protein